MNLEEKLRQLRSICKKPSAERSINGQVSALARTAEPPKPLPAERMPHGVEEYVKGSERAHAFGSYFLASQSLPFGRPYGKMRISDLAAADLSALEIFSPGLPDPSRMLYLDTETTGLAGGSGTCAFMIGIGRIRGADFVVDQFFLRDYAEERAVLAALAEVLEGCDGLVTFNGKTFDVPLLETRYTLARLKRPFERLVHLDLLHPARRLWKLRLESCRLTHLEKEVLGIVREGDVPGSEIPGIYFDYLRTGDARGLQPVFFHNALDIVTLAALTVEVASVIRSARERDSARSTPSLDLFSLSGIFERAGDTEESFAACARAIESGLPESVTPVAQWRLAAYHKRRGELELAEPVWLELAHSQSALALSALRELAILYEHRRRDPATALTFTEEALAQLCPASDGAHVFGKRAVEFTRRRLRLQKRLGAGLSPVTRCENAMEPADAVEDRGAGGTRWRKTGSEPNP